ncbi:nucleotide sugar dehydrogenase [Colletotrichum karsti]|uniref:UDP-glucose 6-dehydrogenase n=1 Tax=Colletotrichum karsti TaxID=1095194 RepID=A0A9P6LL78_9PEZI|nr:nucleotide sugar dehydrogenase [Colletotrichum karsti]KAF9880154.1 nucleotide sugar dehydrogenase [Colletotrichum karsti]
MSEGYVTFASVGDSEESVFREPSTVPTTPDGSCSFSPVLKYSHEVDCDGESVEGEKLAGLENKETDGRSGLSTTPNIVVRNICCVGAGYVGGPTAAVIAFQNPHIRVTVVDRDERRIRRWNSRHPPIYEPGLRDIVRVARDGAKEISFSGEPTTTTKARNVNISSGTSSSATSECGSQCGGEGSTVTVVPAREPNLFFSTRVSECIAEADVILVAVNTPTKTRGHGAGSATDMTAFEAVTAEVARHARPGAIVVEKSTVPCRTAHLVRETLAVHRPGVHFEILSNPEFLAAGTAVDDLLHPDRVLIGSDTATPSGRRAAEALAGVYAAWVPRPRILTTNVWSSELAKLVANSMLAQRVSSINSISAICERTGADVDEVAASVGCDPRIGDKFLKAGIGFGGSCFKKDILSLVYLAESLDLDEVGEYWRQVVKMNEYSRDRFTKRVVKCLHNTLAGKKITVLGYAFKKNTSDTREAPALEIIRTLLEEGPREIAVFDPCCNPLVIREEIRQLCGSPSPLREDGGPLAVYGNAYDACEDSVAVLVTTEFDEFRNKPAPATPTTASPRATTKPRVDVDPRPFRSLEIRQSDVLALHRYLVGREEALDDPLGRYVPEPGCASDCPDCRAEADCRVSGFATGMGTEEYRAKEKIDWARVAGRMQIPRWVFDGRGVIDAGAMAGLGGTEASVLVLSGLAALTSARELQIDDVPVECATICGPIVELSFKCDVDNSFDELRRLKRRKVDAPGAAAPEPRVVRRHHHRRPNQVQADVEATPTLPALDAVPSSNGEFQQLPQPQDAQQPAVPEASPVFIASLPLVASAQDPQVSTPGVQVTPSDVAQPTPSSSSSSSPPPQQPPPPPPPPPQATSVLVVPVFAQPTSTVFLTVPAPSLPPIPQVTVPAPLVPTLPPIQVSIPPVIVPPPVVAPPPRPAPPPQQPPAIQPPPRPPVQQQPPPAQAPQIPSQQSTPSPTPSAAPVMGEGPGKKEPDQKQPDDKETAEKNCICGNKSFDVNLLAGMCQSCIRKSYNRANDMDFIMSQCNFTEATYTPDRDKLAYNIRVVAQKPLLSHSANAMGDAGRIGGGCTMLAAVAVSFVAGMALLI